MAAPGTTAADGHRRGPGSRLRMWGHRRGLLVGLLVLALLAATAWQLADASSSQSQRRATDAHLAAARAGLAATEHRLGLARTALAAATTQRASAHQALRTEREQLDALARELSGAQATLSAQSVNKGQLGECLGGVEQALNEASVGDVQGAAGSLGAVSASCHAVAGQ